MRQIGSKPTSIRADMVKIEKGIFPKCDVISVKIDGNFPKSNGCIGYVTIDYHRRCLRLGCTHHGESLTKTIYCGHGWKERMRTDAVLELQKIFDK
jgi:hypothetical protein